jgi:methylase of polypeptide subunit release factors
MMAMTLDGKLYLAPISKEKKLHRVADLGTGTGIWAIDFGMLTCYQRLVS